MTLKRENIANRGQAIGNLPCAANVEKTCPGRAGGRNQKKQKTPPTPPNPPTQTPSKQANRHSKAQHLPNAERSLPAKKERESNKQIYDDPTPVGEKNTHPMLEV